MAIGLPSWTTRQGFLFIILWTALATGSETVPSAATGLGSGASSSMYGAYGSGSSNAYGSGSTSANSDQDRGAPARCKNTLPSTPRGELDCPISQAVCFTKDGFRMGTGFTPTAHAANVVQPQCSAVAVWASGINCPDGIGVSGVLMTDSVQAGEAGFPEATDVNICSTWSNVGSLLKRCNADGTTCTKAQVIHEHKMSKHAGTLLLKRVACRENKCAVFKTARCIDVGEPVWSHHHNHAILDMTGEAKVFGRKAEATLVSMEASAAANTTCSGAWCAYAGVFNLVYSNGHENQFTITGAGKVTTTNPIGSGSLVASSDSNCPDGYLCARLDGIYPGLHELLAVAPSGNLALNRIKTATGVTEQSADGYHFGHCSPADEKLSRQTVMIE